MFGSWNGHILLACSELATGLFHFAGKWYGDIITKKCARLCIGIFFFLFPVLFFTKQGFTASYCQSHACYI